MSEPRLQKRAVILAGGKGTRLRPYTVVLPKPLMPIGDHPILEVIVRQLARHGFQRITMAVNHQANIIKAFFGDGSAWGVCIDYSMEEEPLGTIAPLALIPELPDHFLLMNGDVLTDLDFSSFLETHAAADRNYTIAAARRIEKADYGVLHVNESQVLTAFEEKPVKEYLVSMGVYAMSRRIVDRIPPRRKFGFDDLMLDLLAGSVPVQVVPYDGYWLDIGRPDDYMRAIDDFESERERFLL